MADSSNKCLLGQDSHTRLLRQVDQLRGMLTSDGCTQAQVAIAWIWARSERAIPIPGFKTVAQVEENTATMEFGPPQPGADAGGEADHGTRYPVAMTTEATAQVSEAKTLSARRSAALKTSSLA